MLFLRLCHQSHRPSEPCLPVRSRRLPPRPARLGACLQAASRQYTFNEKGVLKRLLYMNFDDGPRDIAMHLRSGKCSFQLLFFRQESVQVGLQAALLRIAPGRHGLHFGAQ